MLEGRPSRTALRVAVRRAAHQVLDSPRLIDDPIALRIIGFDLAERLVRDPSAEQDPFSIALRAFLIARSRVAEDELAVAFDRGVRQYVLLGAGLDTFAYRNPWRDLEVFEVDHPATQEWKRALLRQEAIPVPGNVKFVPVDFERDALLDELRRCGFDDTAPAVVAWLGVVPYLSRQVVLSTLAVLVRLTNGAGAVVFDYGLRRDAITPEHRAAFDAVAERVARAGEPWLTFFTPDEIARELRMLGYRRIEDLGVAQVNARFFEGRSDSLTTRGFGRIVAAG